MMPRNKKVRLFCFPYSGASSTIYASWSMELPEYVELHPVELPGRGNRVTEPPHTRIGSLVQKLARELLPLLNMPFALFGHSLGALVSYELARFIRKEFMIKPLHLFVSARRAPQFPDHDSFVHDLPESDLLEELRILGGTPEEMLKNNELMKFLLPIIRADFAICETYSYIIDMPLECPITAFTGLDDKWITIDQIEGWKEHTRANFKYRVLQGDHFFIKSQRQALLKAISNDLGIYVGYANYSGLCT
jgi:medium-chain acyl-[acyl-carrier-protein] hydrolase